MSKGLVMGKFLPLHKGHLALIDFALEQVDDLTVLIVSKEDESIPIAQREIWVKTLYPQERVHVERMVDALPHDGTFSKDHMDAWCDYIAKRFPDLTHFISSETYGAYLATYMGINHVMFDLNRVDIPISATEIRKSPQDHQAYLPEIVKAYYQLKERS